MGQDGPDCLEGGKMADPKHVMGEQGCGGGADTDTDGRYDGSHLATPWTPSTGCVRLRTGTRR
ncbi:hypothetical protein FOWG_17465 [Fusarium oxysporum f. sp. lycopersici MN25]|nr:hypothetical protein FOWG_17465 [Fusarium oxysporum f. sp. lycopersici MN25]